jgi:hypothetical protein
MLTPGTITPIACFSTVTLLRQFAASRGLEMQHGQELFLGHVLRSISDYIKCSGLSLN